MANSPLALADAAEDDDISMISLLRIAAWGTFAAASLAAAVLAGFSNIGSKRMSVALAVISGRGAPTEPAQVVRVAERSAMDESEARVLSEQVRLLAADRRQLMTRIAALERDIEGVTGSIKRVQADKQATTAAQPSAASPPPQPTASIMTVPAGWSAQVTLAPWPETEPDKAAAPEPHEAAPHPAVPHVAATEPVEPAQESVAAHTPAATKPEPVTSRAFGIDLGGGTSVDRLRMLWNSVRSGQAQLVRGLHPVVRVGERAKFGQRTEMRLVAGPIASAEQAARLCAAFNSVGVPCEPTSFAGQRMTLR